MAAALFVMVLSSMAMAETADEAYAEVKAEIESLNQEASRARSNEARMAAVNKMENALVDFRSKYPNTPETADAGFQLGMLKYSTQDFNSTARYLAEYLMKSDGGPREQVAFAHYYLGDAYKNLGKLDDARAEYNLVLRDYSDVNPRLTQFTNQTIADMESQRLLGVGMDILDFEVTGIDGQRLSPDMYKGKVLLLDFWATWCGPCKADMPNVKKVYSKYKSQGFEIVGISLDRSRAALDAYIDRNNIEWPQYFDGKYWQNDVAVQYGVKSIPATYLIDKEGKIRYKSLRGKQLEVAIQALLKEGS